MKKKTERPKRCTECGKVLRPWNKSLLCEFILKNMQKNIIKDLKLN